jgi:fatty acid-binding protein DegV
MIGLVTDSNGVLPSDIVARLAAPVDIAVVPLIVTVAGTEYEEGVDLDADDFYRLLATDPPPAVGTSQPSPGRLLAAYRSQAERGAAEILSIHIGSEVSGTLNAARAAALRAPVPVRLIDSHTASFGVAFAVWAAAEAVAAGATADETEAAAQDVIDRLQNVFVIRALDLAAAGGRIRLAPDTAAAPPTAAPPTAAAPAPTPSASTTPDPVTLDPLVAGLLVSPPPGDHGAGAADDPIAVLSLRGGDVTVLEQVTTVEQAAVVMSRQVLAAGPRLRVAIGIADSGAAPLWQALEAHLVDRPEVDELIRYRISPSVGVHTGPGTAAALFLPWSTPR